MKEFGHPILLFLKIFLFASTGMSELLLTQIELDPSLRIRPLQPEVVDEYREHLDDLPPVVVGRLADSFLLLDGWHRYEAHLGAGRTAIDATLRDVRSHDEARFVVAGCDTHVGLRRSREAKRLAVQMLLDNEHAARWSDRQIAKHTGTTHPFVASVRARYGQAEGTSEREPRQADLATATLEELLGIGVFGPANGNVTSPPSSVDESEGGLGQRAETTPVSSPDFGTDAAPAAQALDPGVAASREPVIKKVELPRAGRPESATAAVRATVPSRDASDIIDFVQRQLEQCESRLHRLLCLQIFRAYLDALYEEIHAEDDEEAEDEEAEDEAADESDRDDDAEEEPAWEDDASEVDDTDDVDVENG